MSRCVDVVLWWWWKWLHTFVEACGVLVVSLGSESRSRTCTYQPGWRPCDQSWKELPCTCNGLSVNRFEVVVVR